jgi:hypothetical protein
VVYWLLFYCWHPSLQLTTQSLKLKLNFMIEEELPEESEELLKGLL